MCKVLENKHFYQRAMSLGHMDCSYEQKTMKYKDARENQ